MKRLLLQYGGLKKELYILFVGKLVTAMGSFVWPMLTFFLTTKLGFSDSLSTLLIATASTLAFPAALLGGKLADHFSRKKIIMLFDSLTVTLYIVSAILPLGIYTAVMVFFAGLFQTIETPAYDALNADFSTTAQRETAFSLSYLGYNLGFIVGAAVSGILFENHTNLAFLLNGLAILVSTVLIALFVHMENAVDPEEGKFTESYGAYEQPIDEHVSVLKVLKDRRVVLWMMLIGCVASMPNTLVGILLPLQLKETMGQTGATVYGYLNSLNGLTVIIFTPILTLLLVKLTEIPKTVIGQLLFVFGSMLFIGTPAVWVLYVGMFVYTLGEVVSVLGSNPYNSRRVPASHRGRIGGISTVIWSVFSSLTQYLISLILFLSENNYSMIWWLFVSFGLAAAVLYGFLYRPDKKRFPDLYKKGFF